MPGIVGLVTQMPREWAEQQLLRMMDTLPRGPSCSKGTLIDESLGLYVGWDVRKGSFCDCLPLRNEREDVVLVFSGEDYRDPSSVRVPKQGGHESPADGARHIVHLGEEDPFFPACLNGRFHGVLANRTTGRVSLFNDRYGMHRLYFHESKEAFYFAANAKAILGVRSELRRINARSIGELLACGCVLENRSLFEGVHVLPPASTWDFQKGSLEKKGAYFHSREWENQPALEPESYYQEIRDTFSRILPRYFNGHEPVAISLTGGLDTRMIMAWRKSPPGTLPCYSFGGMFRDCQDVLLARHVANACGQPHEVITVGKEFLTRFDHYAERTVHLTDGCADVSRSPDLYVNEKACEIAPVRITGNYGGEVLRAVRAFKPSEPTPGLFRPELLSYVQEARETYSRLVDCHPLSFAVFRQAPWHHYGLLALEETQLSLRSPYLDNEFVRTVFRAPLTTFSNNDICLRLIADGNVALRMIRTDRGLNGTSRSGLSGANRAFLEFLFKAEYAYDYGMPQWLARVDHLLSPLHLERVFLGRHKFYHFRVWYRDALSEYVREMLLDSRTLSRPYLERKGVETIVEEHVKGIRNYTTAIHKVLTLELVHRLFLDAC